MQFVEQNVKATFVNLDFYNVLDVLPVMEALSHAICTNSEMTITVNSPSEDMRCTLNPMSIRKMYDTLRVIGFTCSRWEEADKDNKKIKSCIAHDYSDGE